MTWDPYLCAHQTKAAALGEVREPVPMALWVQPVFVERMSDPEVIDPSTSAAGSVLSRTGADLRLGAKFVHKGGQVAVWG